MGHRHNGFILRLSFVAAVLCAAVSCHKEMPECGISLRNSVVGKSSGRIFVSITTEVGWELSVVYPDSDGEDWIEFSKTFGFGSTSSVIMKYRENQSENGRYATIVASFDDGRSATAEFFQRGAYHGGEGTLLPEWDETPGLRSDVVRGWMELPSVGSDNENDMVGCAWVYHMMEVNSKDIRNYSIYYDALKMMPLWVAYPLNPTLVGSGSRTDDWKQKDPKIPVEYQPFTEQGWGQSGYDRGHMIPSADRLRDAPNKATFYPTNMTMQNSNLNQNIWATLEAQTRVWASLCDTLYVVVGAVPSNTYKRDRKGNSVNVPTSYYRALLSYKKGRNPEYAGVAFLFPNQPFTGGDYKSQKMTISELERQLDMNFFVNLPPSSKDAETNISPLWGLN